MKSLQVLSFLIASAYVFGAIVIGSALIMETSVHESETYRTVQLRDRPSPADNYQGPALQKKPASRPGALILAGGGYEE